MCPKEAAPHGTEQKTFDVLAYPICFDQPRYLSGQSAWTEHIPFAFAAVSMMHPGIVVELGTHHGDSYLAFCQAVAKLGLTTKCYAVDTWEGDKHAGQYGGEILERLRTHHDSEYAGFSRLMQTTFDEASRHFREGSVDLLHIDGLHTYEAVRHDFETWLPKMSPRGVVLFHDTNVKERDFGVWRLWDELTQKYSGIEFPHGHGLGILAVGRQLSPAVEGLFRMNDSEKEVVRRFFYALGHKHALAQALMSRDKQLSQLLREREELVRSVSWRITKPLRWLSSHI